MAIFNYTLPSGSKFKLTAPDGTTQAQADKIFYEQVAAGSLTGYEVGQTLTGQLSQLTGFELSRLERGTAGVPGTNILSVINEVPIISSVPNLVEVPLVNPITQADIVIVNEDTLGPNSVGPLTSYQVQKLCAQIVSIVNQAADQISLDKGVGQYGFTCQQLELAGYVKPGTSATYLVNDPESFVALMNTPSIWTGQDGVTGIDQILVSPALQTQIQTDLMQQGYNSLQASGVIRQTPQTRVNIGTADILTNVGLLSLSTLNNLARSGGSLNINDALGRLNNISLAGIGNNISSLATAGLDRLGNLSTLSLNNLGGTLTNFASGQIGGLVANASKFGSQATALWASSGLNLENIGGNLTNFASTGLANLTGGLTGSLNNITSSLTNLVPGNLSNLTANLDIFGKAGSFATNFANPLGNFGSLIPGGGIGGALTGQLGSLQGALTGQLSGLTGALSGQLGGLTSAFGSLGSFANIGAVGDLFGGGGDLVSGTEVAGGFKNTVNRSTVDSAVRRVLGSSKIPTPDYGGETPSYSGSALDVLQAQNILKNFQAPTAFGQVQTAFNNLQVPRIFG